MSALLEKAQPGQLAGPDPAAFHPLAPHLLAHHRHAPRRVGIMLAKHRRRGQGSKGGGDGSTLGLIEVEADGSDAWRLDAAVQSIQRGGVGIIPTDTFPAFVCDLADKAAVQRLYQIKGLSPSQPLSILCSSFQDIAAYTQGFPAANVPGQPHLFRLARQVLPGPYTFILLASKQLPKQCVDYLSGKSKTRRSVGCANAGRRLLPACMACLQAMLEQLERPLLCSSIRAEDQLSGALPDGALLLDEFGSRGLDFVVDNGRRFAEGSSVVDMTRAPPEVVRQGLGDVSIFEAMSAELAAV